MGLFRGREFDAQAIKNAARDARRRKRRRRAIRLYRQLLARDPANTELLAEIAPLLARRGERFEAWQAYRGAIRALVRAGNVDKARTLYREAVEGLPREVHAWWGWAQLELKQNRAADAIETLRRGARKLRGRRHRAQAIYLLRALREIDPWNYGGTLDLVRALARSGQRDEALYLLEGLAERTQGPRRRRVLGLQWRLSATPVHALSWLATWFIPSRAPRRAPAAPAAARRSSGPIVTEAWRRMRG